MPHAVADEKKPTPPTDFKPNKASVLPPGTRARLEAAGIDLTAYPTWPGASPLTFAGRERRGKGVAPYTELPHLRS